MKKLIFLSFLFFILVACRSNFGKSSTSPINDNQTTNESLKKIEIDNKKDSILYTKTKKKLLPDSLNTILGIWIVSTSKTGNASFVLEKDSIYYPETDGRYSYRVHGDSIKIKYDDYIQSLHFNLKGKDTLFLKGERENHVYYRVKK